MMVSIGLLSFIGSGAFSRSWANIASFDVAPLLATLKHFPKRKNVFQCLVKKLFSAEMGTWGTGLETRVDGNLSF